MSMSATVREPLNLWLLNVRQMIFDSNQASFLLLIVPARLMPPNRTSCLKNEVAALDLIEKVHRRKTRDLLRF